MWGWWGYNSTRVATIGEINKGKEPAGTLPPLLEEQKQAAQPMKRVKKMASVKSASPSVKAAPPSSAASRPEPEAGRNVHCVAA